MYAICYLSAMVFTVVLLSLFGQKGRGVALFFASLVFGLIGFCMIPKPDVYVDTIRFFGTLDVTRAMNLWSPQQGWSYVMNDSGYNAVPVMGVIMYLLSLQSQNGWLMFMAAFIDVGAGFIILHAVSKKYGGTALAVSALAFLALFNFNAAVSGVRNYMAGSLALVICYLTSKKSLWYSALFVPLVLIHPFAAIIAFIYIFSLTVIRHKVVFTILCAGLFLQKFLQEFVFSICEKLSFIPFFASLSFKSGQYFGEGGYIGLASIASYVRSLLLFALYAFIIIVCLWKKKLTRYDGICIMLLCLDAGAIQDQPLFSRITGIMLFAGLPMLYGLIVSGVRQLKYGRIPLEFLVVMMATVIVFMDNMRAGISFQNIQINVYSIALLVVLFLFIVLTYTVSGSLSSRYFAPRDLES